MLRLTYSALLVALEVVPLVIDCGNVDLAAGEASDSADTYSQSGVGQVRIIRRKVIESESNCPFGF